MLAFGGGLTATLKGGDINDTQAGSIVLVLANSTLTVQGTKFARNKVAKGAVHGMWSSRLLVQQATFVDNTGQGEGGGMRLTGSNGTVLGSRFDSNVAASAGGAAFVMFSSLHVESTQFYNNKAPIGGAVTVYAGSLVGKQAMVVNSRFDSNVADTSGGAIHVMDNSGLTIDSTELFDNTAPAGGAMAVYDNSRVKFTKCSLIKNMARPVLGLYGQVNTSFLDLSVGGALYMEVSSVSITSSNVSGNRAVSDGGECWHVRALALVVIGVEGRNVGPGGCGKFGACCRTLRGCQLESEDGLQDIHRPSD